MEIYFYNYTGDNRIINKTISETPLQTVQTATPFRPLSDLTGTLLLTYVATAYAANYCSFGGKYYYITDRELLPGQKMQIICRVDVLKTYAEQIKSVNIIPARSSDNEKNNPFLIDTRQPVETTIQHYNIPFNGANLDYANMTLVAGIVGTGGNATDNT